ncbi:MAG: Gfo/Idh/MocA family oxidoreductase [Acidobacteriota bacterium]
MKRVAVIGTGSFGQNHARVYSELPDVSLKAVCDINEAIGKPIAEKYQVDYFSDYRELIGTVDAVSLATPTLTHKAIACDFLKAGIAVLIEKPISRTLEEAEEILKTARENNRVLQIGHLERFNPAVIAASQVVTQPRFFEGHRLSLFTPRSLDIDVVMDLMIHDLDVILSMVKSEVVEIRAAGIPILTPKIDIANARIEFANGCVANLTASRVSAERVRKLRFFQPSQYVSIDYAAQEASMVKVDYSSGGKPDFGFRALAVEREEPLKLEIQSFLNAVDGAPVITSGQDGKNALQLAIGIVEKIKEHAEKIGIPFVG